MARSAALNFEVQVDEEAGQRPIKQGPIKQGPIKQGPIKQGPIAARPSRSSSSGGT